MGEDNKFSGEYRRGFEDALAGAIIAASQFRDSHGTNEWNVKMVVESIEQMTPERHAEWLKRYTELNHREYKREKYQMIIGGRR